MGKSDEINQSDDNLEQEIDQFFEIIGKLADQQDHNQSTEPTKPAAKPASDPHYAVHELSEEMIAKLLTSPIPIERTKGRLLATGVAETVRQFIDHEKDRGTNIGQVMIAVTEVSAMILGSVVAQNAIDRASSEKLLEALVSEFARLLYKVVQLGWTKARDGRS